MEILEFSELDRATGTTGPSSEPSATRHSVVCLHNSEDIQEWAASTASADMEAQSTPVHLIATGVAAFEAIALGARRPALVKSLILGDPEVDPALPGYQELLGDVQAPTLVIAAAPTFDTDISKPQSVAGGIKDGVFVIIDNCEVPAHRSRPHSFNEWATSFINIAEGLHAFTRPEEDGNA
ncbi:alpha/beta fold hydrolase [Paenarthrobacter sp. FR1]|uniref:alpha/beta fold hydrolase n=1 Tax=Paenarthrobacter sp. FR1 TaxID=3439548 RepID=UPI003DA3A5A4